MLPFYQSTEHDSPAATNGINLGLLFNRFFDWTSNFDTSNDNHILDKRKFLNTFYRPNYGNPAQISRTINRQMQLNSCLQSCYFIATSDWHWVTGMGNSHPLENGFCWHHSLAMPYLPGSSVKGLLRAYCEIQEMPKAKLHQWFGSEEKKAEHSTQNNQAGQLIFFDALPCKKADILPDVMTPHTGDWQQEGHTGETAPADWHTPNPVAFLVARNLSLLFSVSLANHADLDATVLDEVKQKLEEALAFLGAGAKTATGYGTMSVNPKLTEELRHTAEEKRIAQAARLAEKQKAAALSLLSENEQTIEKITDALSGTDDVIRKQAIDSVRNIIEIELNNWSLAERQLLASKLRQNNYAKIKNKGKAIERKQQLHILEQGD